MGFLGGQMSAGIAALTAIISHFLSLNRDGMTVIAQVYSMVVNLHLTGFSFCAETSCISLCQANGRADAWSWLLYLILLFSV
jgi:hypothetical protein